MTRTASGGLAVLTPWYPSPGHRYSGAFVQAMVEAVAPTMDSTTVYFCESWLYPTSAPDPKVDQAYLSLLPDAVVTTPTVAGAQLFRLPVPGRRGGGYAARARDAAIALRHALGGAPIPERTVQAHVGLEGGWAAVENAAADAQVFVVEHASFLDRVLADPTARGMYGEVLRRCTGFLSVSDKIKAMLSETFPEYADKISMIANPISFDVARPAPVAELRRWLYVGNLIPLKGVNWLVEAFARCRADDPALTLTIVGDGLLRDELRAQVEQSGMAEAVEFVGSVAPDEVHRLMREHDLLVHASRLETFGMVVVEALAAGMPVLVTRCGGPERTLAGIEDCAGELVAVEEGSDSLVAGFQRLAGRYPHGVDLERARRHLAAEYGYQAIAAAYHEKWFVPQPASGDLVGSSPVTE